MAKLQQFDQLYFIIGNIIIALLLPQQILVKASDLKKDESGVIKQIDPPSVRNKLLDLGFFEGVVITALQSSVTGSIRCYGVNNSVFALRRREAACIEVEREGAEV